MKVYVPFVRSYYHFFTECLVGLLQLMEKHSVNDCEIWYDSECFSKIVQFFSSKPIHINEPRPADCMTIPINRLYNVEDFLILNKLKLFLKDRIHPISAEPGITVIQRTKMRVLQNYTEMVASIKENVNMPVNAVCLDHMSFEEQVRLLQNTCILVAAHGAGLVNMIFMPPKSTIIEVMPLSYTFHFFERMSQSFGHTHFYSEAVACGEKDPRYSKLLDPYPCTRSAIWEYYYGNENVTRGVRDQLSFKAPIDDIIKKVGKRLKREG